MLPCQWEEIAIEHLAGAPAKRIGPPEEFSPFTAPDFEDVFGSGKLLNLNDETASQPGRLLLARPDQPASRGLFSACNASEACLPLVQSVQPDGVRLQGIAKLPRKRLASLCDCCGSRPSCHPRVGWCAASGLVGTTGHGVARSRLDQLRAIRALPPGRLDGLQHGRAAMPCHP